MVNLLPPSERHKIKFRDESTAVCGVPMDGLRNQTERELAFRLDRFLRDRDYIKLSDEEIRKAFALALTFCPASYINADTLSWDAPVPSAAVMEKAIADSLRRVTASRPAPRVLSKPTSP